MSAARILVLGIGNTLLTDEGSGIHALKILSDRFLNDPCLVFLDGGTLSFTLATWFEQATSLIVLDAAELKMPPGTVQTYIGSEMDSFLGKSKRSAHEVGLLDLLDIARLTDHLPDNRALIGIQPKELGWGMTPTPEVSRSLELAVKSATQLIHQWKATYEDQNKTLTPNATIAMEISR